jgi:hypothetical protein
MADETYVSDPSAEESNPAQPVEEAAEELFAPLPASPYAEPEARPGPVTEPEPAPELPSPPPPPPSPSPVAEVSTLGFQTAGLFGSPEATANGAAVVEELGSEPQEDASSSPSWASPLDVPDQGPPAWTTPAYAVNRAEVFGAGSITARGGRSIRMIASVLVFAVAAVGGYLGVTKFLDRQAPEPASEAPAAAGISPEKSAFIAKVDRACVRTFAKQKDLLLPSTAAEFGPWANSLIALQSDFVSDVGRLKAPKQDRRMLDRWIASLRAELRLVRGEFVPAIESGDVARLQALAGRADRLANRTGGLALSYGFRECGEPRSLTG